MNEEVLSSRGFFSLENGREGGREREREGKGRGGGDGVETGCCKLPGRPTRYTIQQDIAS